MGRGKKEKHENDKKPEEKNWKTSYFKSFDKVYRKLLNRRIRGGMDPIDANAKYMAQRRGIL